MKWLEVIELRSTDSDKVVLEMQLDKLLTEVEKEIQGKGVRAYRRVSVETDFSIHLLHESDQIEICGTELGLHIVSALKDFGMVNHTVWKETQCIKGP